jgi:acetyltransferase-like isoleucine patch superfamily enzyme
VITAVNALRHRARFRLWTIVLRTQLRRRSARLVVDAPHGARFDAFPHVKVQDLGEGESTFTLRLGKGVSLGRDLTIEVWARGTSTLELADGAYFMSGVRLQMRGGTLSIGPHAHVRDGCVLKAEGVLAIGEEVTVSFGDIIACNERIEIGDFVGIGERVTITDSDHTHDGTDDHYLRQPLRVTPVRIGRNALISANSVILRGAEIGPNAVVAAGAVVGAGEHPGSWLLAGAPAKPIKPLPAARAAAESRSS